MTITADALAAARNIAAIALAADRNNPTYRMKTLASAAAEVSASLARANATGSYADEADARSTAAFQLSYESKTASRIVAEGDPLAETAAMFRMALARALTSVAEGDRALIARDMDRLAPFLERRQLPGLNEVAHLAEKAAA